MVSIITPCYNGEEYIASCIESVLAQTYTEWEMLIIDDCSSDNSAEIINSYAKLDRRIKYYKTDHPSGSPALPRNIGIENAKGEYFAFLDCDDLWLDTKLEHQIEFMIVNNYDFVYSNYEKMRYDGRRNNRIVRVKNKTTYNNALESCSIPCLTVIIRKWIVGDVRFKDVPKEDYVFWLTLLKAGNVAYNTNTVEAVYRVALDSRSHNKINMIRCQWMILRDIENVNMLKALYCMFTFLALGLRKYIK